MGLRSAASTCGPNGYFMFVELASILAIANFTAVLVQCAYFAGIERDADSAGKFLLVYY